MKVDVHTRRGAFAMSAAFEAQPGEILAVIGPNGSGKSTLLNAIAGLLPAAGSVVVGDRVLDAPAGPGAPRGTHVPPSRRRIALLGQRPLLFPHLSIRENVAFGPRAQGVPRAEARHRASLRLEEVGLGGLAARRPAELSGGQQQRAAIARALAAEPDALLLDEPFAALDAPSAAQARRLIAAQQGQSPAIPILLVTHDPMDALILAARTLVMHDGAVVQGGSTAEVLGHPRTEFVAALAGVNRLEAVGADGDVVHVGGLVLRGHGDALGVGETGSAVFAPGSVRTEPLQERADAGSATDPNHWTGRVTQLDPIPGGIRLRTAEYPGVAVDCPSTHAVALGLHPGQRLAFRIDDADVSVRAEAPRGR
ncbi:MULTISPECIES: sulfate/molybdate ABC transporter ATP-binding protein [unclassified Microbacterium]|uniref:sulfate/molybdate ABC transporter ATP-binding protein n=1 Tax=unclassified Microbacterium TaxID=2609290 RepID=UPI003664CEFA